MILVSVLTFDAVWADASEDEPTPAVSLMHCSTIGDLPLLILGVLMAMAMMGAAYLVRDERMENLLWEFGGEEE